MFREGNDGYSASPGIGPEQAVRQDQARSGAACLISLFWSASPPVTRQWLLHASVGGVISQELGNQPVSEWCADQKRAWRAMHPCPCPEGPTAGEKTRSRTYGLQSLVIKADRPVLSLQARSSSP